MIPYWQVYFETVLHTIPYGPTGATVPSTAFADYTFASGASAAGGPKDSACSGSNIRSGNPGHTSRVQLSHPLLAPGYEVSSVALSFRYAAGYTPPAGKNVSAPTVSLLLTSYNGSTLAKLFTSAPLVRSCSSQGSTHPPHRVLTVRARRALTDGRHLSPTPPLG